MRDAGDDGFYVPSSAECRRRPGSGPSKPGNSAGNTIQGVVRDAVAQFVHGQVDSHPRGRRFPDAGLRSEGLAKKLVRDNEDSERKDVESGLLYIEINLQNL